MIQRLIGSTANTRFEKSRVSGNFSLLALDDSTRIRNKNQGYLHNKIVKI